MDCALCKRPIAKFDSRLNRLEIDDRLSADICQECVDKFLKWQQGIYARLFPTKAVKRRYGK